MAFILNRDKGQRMWGGGNNTFNSSRQGGGGSGAGGGGGVSSSWVDDNYVSKDYFNQLFKVKVAIRVVVTDPSTTPATVVSDTGFVARQDLLYPNEVPEPTQTTDEETGYVTSTTYAIDSIQVMGGLWTNSYLSALGQNSSGGGGGGGSLNEPLSSINMAGLSAPGAAQDGKTVVWNQTTGRWVYGSTGSGTVTSITAGTGLSGGTITGSGTIAIDSTYQTYISHGETAYGWGNHANAGYATQSWVNNQNFLTQTAGDGRYLTIDFFRSLFRAYNSSGTEVQPNTGDTSTIDNIKAMFGFWTNAYISALGQNSSGGGGATDLAAVWESLGRADGDYGTSQINISHLTTALSGYATTGAISDMATKTWVGQQGFLTSNSFSALTTNNEKISATIGTTTRTVQAPTIADLGQNTEAASSSSTPATKFAGAKFGATAGLYLTEVYPGASSPADIPCEYGNMVNILGAGGGQILAEWCGDYTTGHLYYRSHRDVLGSGGWTPWTKLAFTTDNVASATKLATARTLWGQPFDGTANVSGNMTDVGSITASGNIETSGNIKATKFYLSSTVYFQLDNDGNVQLVGAGLWTNSFLSALGQNSSGSGGATDLAAVWESLGRADGDYGTSQINISHLTTALSGYATTSAISDMATKTWVTNQGYLISSDISDMATKTWVTNQDYLTSSDISDMATKTWVTNQGYTTNVGTVTGITAGTGLSGGTITGSGTIAVDSTYQTYISHGETAYGWGNHADAGYWKSSNHPTTLSGYGITDAVNSSTTWWGQSVSSGVIKGSIYAGSDGGIIDGFHSIELNSNGTLSGYGGFIDFHYNGSSSDYTSRIIEDANGRLFMDADNGVRIGDAVLKWDSTNNALYVQRSDGSAVNLYATGGVSALGMSAGTSSVDAMTFNYVTINNRLRVKGSGSTHSIYGDSNGYLVLSGDEGIIFDNDTKINGYNLIITDGYVKSPKYYLDATRYLYVSSGTLYYYNGSTSKQVAFTN